MTTLETTTPKNRGGAPRGNLNSAKHGAKSFRLPVGSFPTSLHRQQNNCLRYRRELEDEVRNVKGSVSMADAHHVDAAVQAELHAALCRHLLKKNWKTLSVADAVMCSKEILRAKEARNRSFASLGLSRSEADALALLYLPDEPQDEPKPANTTGRAVRRDDATGATPSDYPPL